MSKKPVEQISKEVLVKVDVPKDTPLNAAQVEYILIELLHRVSDLEEKVRHHDENLTRRGLVG